MECVLALYQEENTSCKTLSLLFPFNREYPQRLYYRYRVLMSGGILEDHYFAPLPSSWSRTCALIQLAIPSTFAYYPIGVPEEVPNEFNTGNQIAPGFESVLFWWSTINKNRLTTLANESAANPEIEDPFTDSLERWFGDRNGMVVSIFTSLIIGLRVKVMGYYTIP
ncbi:hypothetical protein QTO34_014288, partial [Cnephaeus nilssonii]